MRLAGLCAGGRDQHDRDHPGACGQRIRADIQRGGLRIRRLRPHRRAVSSARRTDGRCCRRSRGAGAEPFGQRATALAGGLLATVSFLWFQSTTSRPWEFIVLTALMGASYALVYTAGSSAYLRAARPGEAGMLAGGARVTSTAIAATGPVVLVSILTSSLVPHTPVPQQGNYGNLWIFLACCGAVICAISRFRPRIAPRPAPGRECRDRVIARREQGVCSPTGSRDARCRLTRSPSARPRARPPDP